MQDYNIIASAGSPALLHEMFPGSLISEDVFGGPEGFVTGVPLSNTELSLVNELILEHLCNCAQNISKEMAAEIRNAGLSRYHQVVDDDLHGRLLNKKGRTLPDSSSAKIKNALFFETIEQMLGSYELADEENRGHQQICFRVSRPNKSSDVGSIHTDTWFWDYHKFQLKPGMGRFKVWFQTVGVPNLSGLLVMPKSHRQKVPYDAYKEGNKVIFQQKTPIKTEELHMFAAPLGTPIMFNHHLLHGGAINKADTCRVSFELTVIFRESMESAHD